VPLGRMRAVTMDAATMSLFLRYDVAPKTSEVNAD